MKEKNNISIEDLLPGYFTGEISESDRIKVDQWKNESQENLSRFMEIANVWDSGELLGLMHQFNAKNALEKINKRIASKQISIWQNFQRIAAILAIPLIIYSAYLTIGQFKESNLNTQETTLHEVNTTTGMHSEFVLPDGTHVWLNSDTKLAYPLKFSNLREVTLTGEAYFEVKEDKKHPFIVNTGKINIEVLGTTFNVANYATEDQTEVVLRTGKVQLFTGKYSNKKEVGILKPNQRAVYYSTSNELLIDKVVTEEYTAWKDGILMFIDDPMDEVAQKLDRWFNVDIVIEDNELDEYIYKATFQDETLTQILDLLKLSAPIDYIIVPRERLSDGKYSKKKIIIRKK